MTISTPLPEQRHAPDHAIPQGQEYIAYAAATRDWQVAIAQALGVKLVSLVFRLYQQRVMWRMTCSVDLKYTNDENRCDCRFNRSHSGKLCSLKFRQIKK